MKKLKIAVASIALLMASAQAGKNVALPISDPIPVPVEEEPIVKPKPTPVANIPLGIYLGGGFTYASSKCQCNDKVKFSNGTTSRVNKGKTYGVNLKAGYTINSFLAVEAKYIYTPWGDKDKSLKHYGLYLKPSYAVSQNLDLYALIGYGSTSCDTLNQKEKGFAWGVGAEYTFNKKVQGLKDGLGVYVEYLRPLKKTGNKNITVDMVNVGASYHF